MYSFSECELLHLYLILYPTCLSLASAVCVTTHRVYLTRSSRARAACHRSVHNGFTAAIPFMPLR